MNKDNALKIWDRAFKNKLIDCSNETMCAIRYAFKQLIKDKWTPITPDRYGNYGCPLPVDDTNVLISVHNDVYMATYSDETKMFYAEHCDFDIKQVSAWMPLPDPYEDLF